MFLFVLYDVFIALVRPHVDNVSDAGTENRVIAERYVYGAVPDAVIVGSSLGRVLTHWLPEDVGNLSFSGGSPITGAEVLVRTEQLPKVVVVETNVMTRSLDVPLVDDIFDPPMYSLRKYFPGLRREFRPSSVVTSSLDRLPGEFARTLASMPDRLREFTLRQPMPPTRAVQRPAVTERPLADSDPEELADPRLAAGLKLQTDYNAKVTEPERAQISLAVRQLESAVRRLEGRNVCVLLVRLPIHPQIDASPLERYMDRAVRQAFPTDRFAWIDIPRERPFHTVDSLHLTGPSARRAAFFISSQIERRVHGSKCR